MFPGLTRGGRGGQPSLLALLSLLALAACGEDLRAVDGTQVLMAFDRAAGFYAAPFPSDDLRDATGGRIGLKGFPNPNQKEIVSRAVELLATARGFALSSGVFFQLSGALDPKRLPDVKQTTQPQADVFLVAIDGTGALRRQPLEVRFETDGGPYGAPNLLSLLPLQGIPLRPGTTHAAVVRRNLQDSAGKPLGVSLQMAKLAAGIRPGGMPEAAYQQYQRALGRLRQAGIAPDTIAGMAVFTTDRPTEEMALLRSDVLSRPLSGLKQPLRRSDLFAEYCVYQGTIEMPVYQGGTPPYASSGGAWVFDSAGKPLVQRQAESNIVVTIPRTVMPASGYPLVAFIRTGGGGNRPLVDRGRYAKPEGPAVTPGSGPALYFARAGFAGVSVDGPHGGRRNVSGQDEQFLMFNIANPAALRDNIRQSALEYILLAHVVAGLTLDVADCPGAGGGSGATRVNLEANNMALMGHSMGATIAPLVLAHEPRYRAAILSGAGASWIENIIHKRKPIVVLPVAELLVGYLGRRLTAHDPVMSLVQWAAESADPQVYARRVVLEPAAGENSRHVLMLQGIVDNYILPRIANALSLPLGLDLAGKPLDATSVPGLAGQTPLSEVLPLVGSEVIPLPASGNVTGPRASRTTAVVVQHREDGIQDGHEVVFQNDLPKHQYRCFLRSFAAGLPRVPSTTSGACD